MLPDRGGHFLSLLPPTSRLADPSRLRRLQPLPTAQLPHTFGDCHPRHTGQTGQADSPLLDLTLSLAPLQTVAPDTHSGSPIAAASRLHFEAQSHGVERSLSCINDTPEGSNCTDYYLAIPFWICSGSRTVLSRTSAMTAALTASRVEKRKARPAFSGKSGKTGLKPGRAESERRMELFWKLELIPASLILRVSSS